VSDVDAKTRDFELQCRRIHPAVFPVTLALRVIKNYTHPGETVLDPFAGVGTTVYAAKLCNRHAIGIELNPKYVEFALQKLYTCDNDRQTPIDNDIHYELIQDDARNLLKHIPMNTIDLIFTSPPYWDMLKQKPSYRNLRTQRFIKKNYSNDWQDLSNEPKLSGFLNAISYIFGSALKVLKRYKRCIINTADYRRRGRYIPLHAIYITVMNKIGYRLKNIIIWDRRSAYKDLGIFSYPYNFIVNNGMVEYMLEFYKY
jgi:DNA modification methylase